MLVIEFRFPAGRFHATPWGRNVNEGEVEWPPSPFRFARALMDICKRRRPDWSDSRLECVLSLIATHPRFLLPKASVSHIRSYLSSNDKDPSKKQKIFDAFVALDRDAALLMGFDGEADPDVRADLADLLGELNYLGRSESWVSAKLLEADTQPDFNCFPAEAKTPMEGLETVKVACLRPPDDYEALPKLPTRRSKGNNAGKPLSWLEALAMSTQDLLDEGWSSPPALLSRSYLRSATAFRGEPGPRKRPTRRRFRVARYALQSPVLPLVTDTVSFAERVRVKLMGMHKRLMNGDEQAVSPLFSGKSKEGGAARGHRHAFILPLDEDRDGRIDHVLVRAADPFTESELRALDRLRSVRQSDGRPDVEFVLTALLAEDNGPACDTWVSATPFVLARHHRKGRGSYTDWLEGELRKECSFYGLPEPVSVEWIDRTQAGHPIRWIEFRRGRKDRSPLRGHGCVLRFREPVRGLFALGALSHYGLGLFVPMKGRHDPEG